MRIPSKVGLISVQYNESKDRTDILNHYINISSIIILLGFSCQLVTFHSRHILAWILATNHSMVSIIVWRMIQLMILRYYRYYYFLFLCCEFIDSHYPEIIALASRYKRHINANEIHP